MSTARQRRNTERASSSRRGGAEEARDTLTPGAESDRLGTLPPTSLQDQFQAATRPTAAVSRPSASALPTQESSSASALSPSAQSLEYSYSSSNPGLAPSPSGVAPPPQDATYSSIPTPTASVRAPTLIANSNSMSKKTRRSQTQNQQAQQRLAVQQEPMAVSSSLDSVRVTPRTPRANSHEESNGYRDRPNGHGGLMREEEDSVEMSLLDEEQRRRAAADLELDALEGKGEGLKEMSKQDRAGIVLLCILYLIQGVPLGLALGSVPFLLREHLSYSQLGTFALSSYPYSLKLLWSPIVDTVFFRSIGRRKSWIIPMQLIVGSIMLYISYNVQILMDDPANHINQLTFLFTSLVFFSATQDIAVDGWALTLLSHENLSYASTCQTIGLNTGYFASFTVFLALNSEAFTSKWGIPLLSLSTYLWFWSFVCFAVTLGLLFFKKEGKESEEEDMSIGTVYKTIWAICKLKHVQQLIILHLVAKIGFAANEAVTSLKMVEKGLGREDLAIAVLIDFPCQMIGGWLTARWSRGDKPLKPWIYAFLPRLGFSVLAPIIIYCFPRPPISTGFFVSLVVQTVLGSFTSTVQFVGISAFHTRISDPLIGGTYMTLLNTFSNMGGTYPKWFVLKGVDLFTVATCRVKEVGEELLVSTSECVSDHGKTQCSDIGGQCVTETDGFYAVSAICVALGAICLVAFILPTARKLQSLPTSKWHVKIQ